MPQAQAQEREERGGRVERYLMPFVREPTLWPVLIVLLAHAAAFIAPAMIFAWRDGGRGSAALLGVLVLLSAGVVVFEIRRWRRPAALTAVLVVTWALSVLLALLAARAGLF
jgi:hypothetical protein